MKGPDNPFFFSLLQLLEQDISARGYAMLLVRVPHGADEVALAARTCAVSKPAIDSKTCAPISVGSRESSAVPHM